MKLTWTFLLPVILSSGCLSLSAGGGHPAEEEEVAQEPETKALQQKAKAGKAHLEQARLWIRIAEIEQELHRQKEKVQLLEQRFLLGINPLNTLSDEKSELFVQGADGPPSTPPHASHRQGGGARAHQEATPDFAKEMRRARQLFAKGQYGGAHLEFMRLAQEHPEEEQPLYWQGRSWQAMKELPKAQHLFTDFLQRFPQSSLTPKVYFHLAKVEKELGLDETAYARLQKIVRDFPTSNMSELARRELKGMRDDL